MIKVFTGVACFEFDMDFEKFVEILQKMLGQGQVPSKSYIVCPKQKVAVKTGDIIGFKEVKDD